MGRLWVIACCLSACAECSDHRDARSSGASDTSNRKAVSTLPALSSEKSQALKALGYFERAPTENPEDKRVTERKADAQAGLNLYSSRHEAKAYLVDMAGKVVHTWAGKDERPGWMHVEMLPDGALLAIADYKYVAKLDWDGNLLWQRTLGAHHDLHVDAEGRVLVLTYRVRRYPFEGGDIPIKDVDITVLSPKGKVLSERPLFPLLRHLVPRTRLAQIKRRLKSGSTVKALIQENAPADVLHTNSLQILDAGIPAIAPPGSVLLSVREVNRVVVIDPKKPRVLWEWGQGELEEQHHATLLDNGRITIFDNGVTRKQSRVLEIDPATGTIAWSYTAPDFYSRLRGGAQKLPGGNVLITESDKGHVFEVDPDGNMVWEFWNPDIIGEKTQQRAVIYRMKRYPRGYLTRSVPAAGTPSRGGS